ncbi:MAG: hypothetical protein F4Y61_08785 [Rhodothermaceae bacterium]|nr:hypothetical protein [Rhodothermaceae bacterium]
MAELNTWALAQTTLIKELADALGLVIEKLEATASLISQTNPGTAYREALFQAAMATAAHLQYGEAAGIDKLNLLSGLARDTAFGMERISLPSLKADG